MWETEMWARSLGQEDALEKEMATHGSIFAWEILEHPTSHLPFQNLVMWRNDYILFLNILYSAFP